MTDRTDTHREERREDIRKEMGEALPRALKEALPDALKEALPAALATLKPDDLFRPLGSDMRPPRDWPAARTHLEDGMEAGERRAGRGKALRDGTVKLGGEMVLEIIKHVLISGSAIALFWQFIIRGTQH